MSHVCRAVVNSLLAASSGIALNLKSSKANDENHRPLTVKIGDEEYVGGGGLPTNAS